MNIFIEQNNRCVMCGEIIPEGNQVCRICYEKYSNPQQRTIEKRRFSLCSLIARKRRKVK